MTALATELGQQSQGRHKPMTSPKKLPDPLKINFREEEGRCYGWVEGLSFSASGKDVAEVESKINNAIRSLIKRNYIVNKGQDWYFAV